MEREQGERDRMDRRLFCSKRGEMGNKRLGGLLLWQVIHSSSAEQRKRRGESGEWKSKDGQMSVETRGDDLRHALWHRSSAFCIITSCLSDDEIRGICCSPVDKKKRSHMTQ